tara:strand:- start:1352 stop:2917 length:1566 start_codon:yes stop_codon:yes gene_type:complete
MFGKNFAQMAKNMRMLGAGTSAFNKPMQKTIFLFGASRKLLGPVVDLFVEMKAAVQLVSEVLGTNTEQVEKSTEEMGALGLALNMVKEGFRGIFMAAFTLVGLFLTVTAVLVTLTGSFSGAVELFPAFYQGFDQIYASAMSVVGSLSDIGASILSVDFSPLLEIAGTVFGGIIMFVVNFASAFMGFIADMFTTLADLFAFMAETGAFQAIVDGVAGILTAFVMVFGYIGEILDVFGINFENAFAVLSTVFRAFVFFLMNSGLIEFFALAVQAIGTILPPVVFVIGEILVAVAKVIAFFAGPLVNGIIVAMTLIAAGIGVAIKLIVLVVKGLANAVSFILEGLFYIFTQGWKDAIDFVVGIFSNDFTNGLVDSLEPVIDFFSSTFDFLQSLIMGFIDFVTPPLEDLFGFVGDVVGGVGDAVGGFVGGAADFLGFHSGGISTGPASGYPVTLHGTEAVVPLPDGNSIPVTLQSMGGTGGENITVNISVSGGGNAREVAKAVSQEVQRVFRSRSRGGGFGRGVI